MGEGKKHKVLVCPLDWGLGHAARCVPIISKLIETGNDVIIAADNFPYEFLRKEFPSLRFIRLFSYNISYPSKGSMALRMLLSLPGIVKGIYREHQLLKSIIKDHEIDVVISDNRYGLWNNNIHSIFITHQVMVKCPLELRFLEDWLYKVSRYFISKYNTCWIPDFGGAENLSGDLSHKYPVPKNAVFINPVSRFKFQISNFKFQINSKTQNPDSIDLLVILSGPEPQRTIFEAKVREALIKSQGIKAVIVRGKLGERSEEIVNENLVIYSHAETDELYQFIWNSKLILCRPGYTSIMDLAVLGKKAIFIPTQGQTEQEYLAEYLMEKKMFYYEKQDSFVLERMISEAENYLGIKIEGNDGLGIINYEL